MCGTALVSLLRCPFFFLLSGQIKEKIPGTCSVLPFSHSSACWLFSPSCICKRNKHHTQKVCQATRSPFAQQRYVAKYSPFCFVYLIFVLQSVVFCTVLPSALLVFSLTFVGEWQAGAAEAVGGAPRGEGKVEGRCQRTIPVSPHQARSPRASQRARWTHLLGRWRPSGCPSRPTRRCGSS